MRGIDKQVDRKTRQIDNQVDRQVGGKEIERQRGQGRGRAYLDTATRKESAS